MARKSRRRTAEAEPPAERRRRAVLYARLSAADNGLAAGDSLEVQVALLRGYLDGHRDRLEEAAVFRDNGVSGVHFRRPGFQGMMAYLRQGKGDCVVVKDLSRLGRDWVETCALLEEVFPALGVEVRPVNEGGEGMLDRALRCMGHDFYARDLGEKIGSAIAVRRQDGVFWGKKPPYGYAWGEEKHSLRPQPEEAEAVRQLFARRAAGWSVSGLARAAGRRPEVIRRILTDPVYAGYLPLRQSTAPSYRGDRPRPIPPPKRRYVAGQVPALVPDALFGAVWRSVYPDGEGEYPWEER